jgi:antirestriction protein
MEGSGVKNTQDLIRGFENVVQLVEELTQVLGKKKLSESTVKKGILREDFFPADLPEFREDAYHLHEDFEGILGIKRPFEKKAEDHDHYAQMKKDAKALIESLKAGSIAEDEAHQILALMTESLDQAVETVVKESAETGEDETQAGSYEKLALEPMMKKLAAHPGRLIKKVESDEGELVKVMKATHPSHAGLIGIHLHDPSESEIEDAIEQAFKDGFEYVWVHAGSQEEAVRRPSREAPGKEMTPAKKAEMGKSLSGKFVRSGDMETAKKIMKHSEPEMRHEAQETDAQMRGVVLLKDGVYCIELDEKCIELKHQEQGPTWLNHEVLFYVNEDQKAADLQPAEWHDEAQKDQAKEHSESANPETRKVEEADLSKQHVGAHVTLDGKPAIISNADPSGKFAKVSQTPSGHSVEFSWDAVDQVMKKGGEFKSGPRESVEEAFMKPQIFKSKGLEIDTAAGSFVFPSDVISYSGPDTDDAQEINKLWDQIKDYVEVKKAEDVYSIKHVNGWFGRLSASGYLDSTDYIFGDSKEEVKAELERIYGDDDPEPTDESKKAKKEDAIGGGSYPPGENPMKEPEAEMAQTEDKKVVARWESKSGKHWVELCQYDDGGFGFRSPDSGGVMAGKTMEDALAELQKKIDAGYFQPDAAKTSMKRVEGADVAYVPGTARAMRGIPEAKQKDESKKVTAMSVESHPLSKQRGLIGSDREKIRALKPKNAMSVKIGEQTYGLEEEAKPFSEPRVYVGTYGKYNEGSIEGKWLDLEDYASKEEFLKACQELHQDESDPEFMFQDFEGFPEQYYDENGLSDDLWDWLKLSHEDRELLQVYQDEVIGGQATIEQAREAFRGKAKSEGDWAYEDLESLGGVGELPEETLGYFLHLSETDIRVYANDEADHLVRVMSDEEIVEKAGMQDEYEKAQAAEALSDELEDLSEYDEDDLERIQEIQDELSKLGEVATVEKVLDSARDEALSEISDEVKKELKDDALGYFEKQGFKPGDLVKNNVMSFDYEAYAKDLEISGDYTFVHHDHEVWVFSNH